MRYALAGVLFFALGMCGLLIATVTEPSHFADVFGYTGVICLCIGVFLGAVGLVTELWNR